MTRFDPFFQTALDDLDRRHLKRVLSPVDRDGPVIVRRDGASLLDFSSNDYLGLSHHPALRARAIDWTERFGIGSGASRLVTGTSEQYRQVEARLARFKGTEAALLLASGWQANAAVLPALLRISAAQTGEPALVFTDRLNHASLHHGCQAAGVRQIRFAHNDLGHLEHLLAQRQAQRGLRFIVTESVFSMDGDRADVAGLRTLADRYGAFLYLDEAHATGVLGPQGRGLSAEAGGVDLAMGTFSKALGGFGAYVAGSRAVCDWLVSTCSGFIYTTALPPGVLGVIDAALDLVPTLDAERAHLAGLADRMRAGAGALGWSTGPSSTQIVPVIVGAADRALTLARALAARGMLGTAIRPPTVPAGSARIRVALSAAHDETMVDRLLSALEDAAREHGIAP
ncbi:aminotransferase class I/II-fold pyridoxal phosphate-dependent enzyme [Gluconacetobacter diazotrophicus]|uniref:8-amino-7-oxononanoate synthase n=1 Tax=Gluconacetobacter diazotrophicus (strain ATCC 49037 / DSM 5601 / CCUG 37298 / CIP 103539 / LMG 7603 / PAl5) TaxID=272568 RepID=BIOF_GLUDA|nr:8-amino-7-oxononanoate synthase [Gluconacetobacter diazotrophicus]A9HJ57.2 RecName: Full=8-amino-7-oxononanoate synthase; Short=AONS; AltName: Full=7-keto-8-amino-pelargonic acid synthase; Short=7-KAP synthase; Short=KAPA synthase; AltName: Full=8-amino-7-ketopelargonate synthase; AltName: Full=Alpha-oxoamine synthase [Gluconacetobacter diazotrophicus PA1 5]